jgi:hypothetical protein
MTGPTKEITKKKLRNLLYVIRNVLNKILIHNEKESQQT